MFIVVSPQRLHDNIVEDFEKLATYSQERSAEFVNMLRSWRNHNVVMSCPNLTVPLYDFLLQFERDNSTRRHPFISNFCGDPF
jgi:hypothetical protein